MSSPHTRNQAEAKSLLVSAKAVAAVPTKTDTTRAVALPVEVWQIIMKYFILDLAWTADAHAGLQSMSSFAQTCRTFTSLARPILYSYVDLTKDARNREGLFRTITSSLGTWKAPAHTTFLQIDLLKTSELAQTCRFASMAPLQTLTLARHSDASFSSEEIALYKDLASQLGAKATLKSICLGHIADQEDGNDIATRLLSIPSLRNVSLANCRLISMAERTRLDLRQPDLSQISSLYLSAQCCVEDVPFDGLEHLTARYEEEEDAAFLAIKAANLKELILGTEGVAFCSELIGRLSDNGWMPLLQTLQIDFLHTMRIPPTRDDMTLLTVLAMVTSAVSSAARSIGRRELVVQCTMRGEKDKASAGEDQDEGEND